MDRYLLVDPAGLALVLIPVQNPIEISSQATVSSGLTVRGTQVTGSSETRFNFGFKAVLPESQYRDLQALTRNQEAQGRKSEIVVYYLWDKTQDLGSTPLREPVPGLDTVLTGYSVAYYPVIQGDLIVDGVLLGAGTEEPWYGVTCQFFEGTIRRP